MAMNKYMHPRNIYKTPPDFRELALKYPEFGQLAELDLNGKIKVNFKDEKVLRELTNCLLKRDFNLDVWLPETKLIPTLSLRLNYILWLEDLLAQGKFTANILGIDIGCGASCIYPLLAAKKNQWNMIGLENNEESWNAAKHNVTKNNLTNWIDVRSVTENGFFTAVPEKADFCMCNPPFYSSAEEMDHSNSDNNRTGKRSEPKNASSGSSDELIFADGGECEFVRLIIEESLRHQNKIKIYTTMLGHKKSLNIIQTFLNSKGITNVTQTEFCQGRTTRWGIAWSFNPFIYLKLAPTYGPTVIPNKTLTFTLPGTELVKSFREVEFILQKVGVDINEIEFVSETLVQGKLFAYQNTWSNQRRKRRELQRQPVPEIQNNINMEIEMESGGIKRCLEIEPSAGHQSSIKKIRTDNCSDESIANIPILVVQLNVQKIQKSIQLELIYLNGLARIDGVHQLLQYVNNFYSSTGNKKSLTLNPK